MNIKKTRRIIIILVVTLAFVNEFASTSLHDKSTNVAISTGVLVATIVLAVLLIANEARKE
jgi:uncharacterized membrane protein (DUF485 family)